MTSFNTPTLSPDFALIFSDSSGAALNSLDLPMPFPGLNQFDYVGGEFSLFDPDADPSAAPVARFGFSVDSLTMIPTPGSGALLAAAGMCAGRRRKR